MGRSWDVKLGGKPLYLAPAADGGVDVYLATDESEPGTIGQIGTIVIPSLHHGLGPVSARDPMKVWTPGNLDTSLPGTIIRAGGKTNLLANVADENWYDSQGGGLAPYPHLNDPADMRFMAVTARRIYRVDPATPAVTEVYVLDNTKYAFTGSWCVFRGSVYFGVESNIDGTARGYYGSHLVQYKIATNTFTPLYWAKGSVVQAAKGGIWWIENRGFDEAPNVYWTDSQDFPGEPLCYTVKYTGNGTSQSITGFPFQPDVVFVKSVTEAQEAVLKTDTMAAGESRLWNTAGQIATGITAFLSNGFSVGSHAAVNQSGKEFVAVGFKKKAGLIDTLAYDGTGADNRDITTSFSPDLVFVTKGAVGTGLGHTATRPETLTGDATLLLGDSAEPANLIQALGTNSFQVGTDVRVNENVIPYHAIIFKEAPSVLKLLSYVGDSQDNREISVEMEACYAIVRPGGGGGRGIQRMAAKSGDYSVEFYNASYQTNCIQALGKTSVQVGTNSWVNGSGATYYMMAFGMASSFVKAGPFPIEPGGYCTAGGGILGPWAVWFKRDGQIYGMDTDGTLAPILPQGMTSADLRFGRGNCVFNQQIIIPHAHGCLSLNMSTLSTVDIHPSKVAEALTSLTAPGATAALWFGSRLFITLATSTPYLACYEDFSDGFYYNILGDYGDYQYKARAVAARLISTGAVQLFVLTEGTTSIKTRLERIDVAGQGWSASPNTVRAGYVFTPYHSGEGGLALVTKRFFRLRGWAQGVTANDYYGPQFALDGGGYTALGDIKTNGPFSCPFPAASSSLGRAVSIAFVGYGTTVSAARLEGPFLIDFEYLPATHDRLRLGVMASWQQLTNRGDVRIRDSALDVEDFLFGLRGTVTTLIWPTGVTWNVLVEKVARQTEEPSTATQGQVQKLNVWVRRL